MYNYFVIQMVANLFELLLNWQIIIIILLLFL